MTGVSTLGSAISKINLLNTQSTLLNKLTLQLASGRKTTKFAGLENDILVSQRARADFQTLERYIDNIKGGERRIEQSLLTIQEFQKQAENFSNAMVGLLQESAHQEGEIIYYDDPFTTNTIENTQVGMTSAQPDIDLRTLQDFATNLFDLMGDLLNTKETDRYLLGGADTLKQPYTDTGTLDAAMSTLINQWKDETLPPGTNLTSDELFSALSSRSVSEDPFAVTDTIIGYSAELSAGNVGKVFTHADQRTEVDYTVLANEDPFRDIMVAVSFLKNENLTPIADVYAEPYTPGDPTLADGAPGATIEEQKENFYNVFNKLIVMVNKALDDIDGVRYRLENARVRLNETRLAHENQQNVLKNSIDDVENVDINEVALQLNSLQIQLDASYRITASVQQLSLVNFI